MIRAETSPQNSSHRYSTTPSDRLWYGYWAKVLTISQTMATVYGPTSFQVNVPAGKMVHVQIEPAKKKTSGRIGIDAHARGLCYNNALGSWVRVLELFVARGISDQIDLSDMPDRYMVRDHNGRLGFQIGGWLLMETDKQLDLWSLAWGCSRSEVMDRLIRHYTLQ